MKTFVEICLLAVLCVFVKSEEPECSRFHYEEKTLEKMIKTEIHVDKIKMDTEMMQQKTIEKVNGIQEELEKTKDELNNFSAENQKVVDEIKDKVNGFQTTPVVAFNAHDITKTTHSNGETLIFRTTTFDRGSGYSNVTGVFIAPVAGVYLFTLQLCLYGNRYVYFQIVVGETPILKGCFNDDGTSYNGCQSASAVAVLNARDHVSIKHVMSSGGTDFWKESYTWNSFSGVLITEITK